jgi:hypothetical protein
MGFLLVGLTLLAFDSMCDSMQLLYVKAPLAAP